MYVSAILKSKGSSVHTIAPEASLADAARQMTQTKVGALVVSADGNTIDGILSERDIVASTAEQGPGALDDRIAAHMSRDVVTCKLDDTLAHLMQVMTVRRIRHLPVVEDDKLIGIVSIGDVVKNRMEEIEKEADEMRHMISGG